MSRTSGATSRCSHCWSRRPARGAGFVIRTCTRETRWTRGARYARGLHDQGYRIAQVTLDHEDYLWNGAYARCAANGDAEAIKWLRSSYLTVAAAHFDADREMAKTVFGREIDHVLLLHLGAFSSVILPDLFDLLRQKGFTFVTLEQAQRDSAYATDPDAPSPRGGTLLEQWLEARKLPYPQVMKKPREELAAICASGEQ